MSLKMIKFSNIFILLWSNKMTTAILNLQIKYCSSVTDNCYICDSYSLAGKGKTQLIIALGPFIVLFCLFSLRRHGNKKRWNKGHHMLLHSFRNMILQVSLVILHSLFTVKIYHFAPKPPKGKNRLNEIYIWWK